MSDADDTPRHWLRDLFMGAAIVLALAQTWRISATEEEIGRLKTELANQEALRIVYKSAAPLVRVQSLRVQNGTLDAELQPLRPAAVDVQVFDAAQNEVTACRKSAVTLPLSLHCPTVGASATISVVER